MSNMHASKLFDVKDKVVLVTGGGRGIGEMIAEGYVSNGAKVYIASRDIKACEATAARLNKQGPGKCYAMAADLSKYEDIVKLIDELSKKEQTLNVLVNNSGANWGAPLDEYPDQAFSKVMNLNVNKVFTITQKALPLLRNAQKKDGVARVINIGSVNGVDPPALETYAYSASKAALHQYVLPLPPERSQKAKLALSPDSLSRVLASRLGPEGITVNTLACGPFQSKMMAVTLEKFEKSIVEGLPLGRIGTPEDVSGVCLFLSSRAGAYTTGATIPVDGGSLVKAKL
ncbi:hypothetical protein QFC22_000570 [Naganishia vaughanmartiniae]|uniref:Uncharacterized protein n=1 Tax=Naganishia vaughanmartiniae TaxID=1424756 RepID=A0ACC2XP31_9TREE|nr:hypothetical protein QFC22_000570 [Naganishia vaughanmartiniae]